MRHFRANHRNAVTPLFSLGHLVVTRGAKEALATASEDVLGYVARHAVGDWGDIDDEDRRENERCLQYGCRLLSAYTLRDGTRIWIVTEPDRSSTTALLPGEF